MSTITYSRFVGLVLALLLSACSSDADHSEHSIQHSEQNEIEAPVRTVPQERASRNTIDGSGRTSTAPEKSDKSRTISLERLGELEIGQPLPTGGKWAERGAQPSDLCRTVTSPEFPGVYAIVVNEAVRRITVGQRSDVKLAEGIGIGSSLKDVVRWFPSFRSEPHKYEKAPARYLTAPNAADGVPALRIEIGRDKTVSAIHVGTMPELALVEGCA